MSDDNDGYAPKLHSKVQSNCDKEAVFTALVGVIAERLGIDAHSITLDSPLETLGLTSLAAVACSTEVGERIGIDLPPTLLLEGRTPKDIVEYVCKFAREGRPQGRWRQRE